MLKKLLFFEVADFNVDTGVINSILATNEIFLYSYSIGPSPILTEMVIERVQIEFTDDDGMEVSNAFSNLSERFNVIEIE